MNTTIKKEIYQNLPDELVRLTASLEGREKDIVLLSSIGAISSILPNLRIEYRGDNYYANIFLMIIAPPASGKGKMNLALRLLKKIHEKILQDSGELRDICLSQSKKKDCPPVSLKILPGNISCAKVYKHLNDSNHGLIIFESEADSLSGMLSQDWGNFSDVLRKVFHHEKISISRSTDDLLFEVNSPCLSLVLSGTTNQLKPLIKSNENGLFSRFLYYHFNDKTYWKPASTQSENESLKGNFELLGDKLFALYGHLVSQNLEDLKLTTAQMSKIDSEIGNIHDKIVDSGLEYFTSSVKRHGIILSRIILILSVLRNIDEIMKGKEIEVVDIDVDNAIELIKLLISHALSVYDIFDNENNILTENEQLIFNELNFEFKRFEAIEIANKFKISERTTDYHLSRWVKNNIITKVSNGCYRKESRETARVANFAILARE
ncbi:DUF3987 domain-containing protein [Leeuwenhoekiella parthenopeia]|uniref:DUF3987 domain-containing protein n=1 Tax=Leeuwenhoekiella parthenopeia TaxID=2890320 RepID=A0ABS8GQI6_9FLAO|nr:DUF3987 domain-containing protein [Leeuwenhoekiella parthenopeia]MCC4212256.1 DUF3987 domain-containing protein [Leeuwenhoekiella parthenopeia]